MRPSRNDSSILITRGPLFDPEDVEPNYGEVRTRYDTIEGLYFKDTPITPRSSPIFMLPHSKPLGIAVIISIVLHVYWVSFTFTYDLDLTMSNSLIFIIMHYGMEALYSVYLVATLVHRHYSIHMDVYCSKKMPFMQLLIGLLTLIPLYEIYEYLLMRDQHIWLHNIVQLKVILRLSHVVVYFRRLRAECTRNRIYIIFFESAVINSLYICTFSCLFTWLGCYGCEFSNWTTHVKDILYDNNNLQHRLVYPMVLIGSLVMGNYNSVLMPETIPELSCVLFTMMMGLVMMINFMVAQLISEYVLYTYASSMYKMRIRKIHKFIEVERLSKPLRDDILEYFNVLWAKRTGITRWDPSFISMLPSPLRNEVKLDLSWDALKHSHFFRDQSITVKTAIAKTMINRFMVKGDVIYDPGDLRLSFIYIVSGLVQLLSDEDDESPVMTFSSGTVISEIACLMLSKSEYKLQCASYCELRVIYFIDFYRGMAYYREHVQVFHRKLLQRIRFARRLMRRKGLSVETLDRPIRPIRRVKLHWHNLADGIPLVDVQHTSRFMDLLALKNELDVKVGVVCLTSKFPLIMDPNSSFRQFCEMIVLAACLIETAIIPYCAAFPRGISTAVRSFFILLDIVYALDIYIQVTTAVEEDGRMIVKFSAILLRRVQQMTFLIDVIAMLPIDYVYWALGCTSRTFILLKIPRVLKIYKLIKLVKKLAKHMLDVNGILVLLLKYYLLWFVCVYFFICIFYAESCFEPDCVPFSWYAYNLESANLTTAGITPVITSLLYVVDLLSVAKKNLYAYNYTDSLISLLVISIGYYLLIFGKAELAATHYWQMHEKATIKTLVSAAANLSRLYKLPSGLVQRIIDLIDFRWRHTEGLTNRYVSEFLTELPAKIEVRAREEMVSKWLDQQAFFQTLDPLARMRVLQMAQLISFPEGAKIVQVDQAITLIYMIKKGICRVTSMVPGDVDRKTDVMIYKAGACFPIIEVLHMVPAFVDVVAVTAVDLIMIKYHEFCQIIVSDPVYHSSLMAAMKSHIEAHKIILLKSQYRRDYKKRQRESFFTYDINDNIEEEVAKQKKILTMTIDPHSGLYTIYEVIRCFLVLFQFVILCLQMNLFYKHRFTIQMLNILCDFLSWLDIAIRCRLHYYQHNGVLVTAYKSTIKYYIKHSFAVDFYASCPFYTLSTSTMTSIAHPVIVGHFFLLISRPLQLYRVFMGIKYLCNSTNRISEANVVRIQCILFVMVLLPIGSNLLVLFTCTIDYDSVTCPMNGWTGGDIIDITTSTGLAHYMYLTALYLRGSPLNHYAEESNFSYGIYVFFSVKSLFLGWFLMSKLISLDLHGHFMTLQLQNARRNYQIFAKLEGINERLSEKLLQVNVFMTRDSESNVLVEAEKRISPQLFHEVSMVLNQGTLMKNALFYDNPEYIQRTISYRFNRTNYMKDDIILRINDINPYIFFVQKGCVAISVADCELTQLTQGGMFGCISDKRMMRQTINAKATMHTELIYLEAQPFQRCIYNYVSIKNRMRYYIKVNAEFVKPSSTESRDSFEMTEEVVDNPKSRFFNFIHRTFDRSQKAFGIYYYVMDVHLATFSTMFVFVYQMEAMHDNVTLTFRMILYMLDLIFVFKIFIGLLLPYVDEASGLVVRHSRKIIRRYLFTDFGLDLLVILTPELVFTFLFPTGLPNALLTSNRLVRIVFLIRYYSTCSKENRLTHDVRWIFLAYITVVYIQFFTNVWHYVACSSHLCRYRKFISHEPEDYIPTLSLPQAYLLSYIHVVNFFTGNSLQSTKPLNVGEIVITTVIVVSSLFMITTITSGYAFVQIIDNHYLDYYKNNLKVLTTHLENMHLSPSILKRVVRYYEFIWKNQRGEQMPILLIEARQYIREDIYEDLYTKLILTHVLFKDVHKDFFRQLLLHVKRMVYPRSMIIVEQHVINGKMYFIQSGQVEMVEETEEGDIKKIGILQGGECFGEVQGLTGTPHDYTYVADSLVVILYLKKEDWLYLLEFFPATHESIWENLKNYFGTSDTTLQLSSFFHM